MKLNKEQQEELRQGLKLELYRRDFYLFCVYIDPKFFTIGKPHLD